MKSLFWLDFRPSLARQLVLYIFWSSTCIRAQSAAGKQIFTKGLSIIDSPASDARFQAGANIPISIEVSGNGKLPLQAAVPGSGLATRFDQLNIFLLSSQLNVNLTVSEGPQLLTNESGSVRHLNWPIPSCVTQGPYNLTFYEASHINGSSYFSITPIPISIQSESSGRCTQGLNPLEAQPQPSSPLDHSPFSPGQENPAATSYTVTQAPSTAYSGMATSLTGAPPTVTIVTPPVSVTIVVVSIVTTTTTKQWIDAPFTTTFTTTKTTVAPMSTQNLSGFIPVNTSFSVCAHGFLRLVALVLVLSWLV